VPSEQHESAPKMTWKFEGWKDSQTMTFKLSFDKPEIVSMEMP